MEPATLERWSKIALKEYQRRENRKIRRYYRQERQKISHLPVEERLISYLALYYEEMDRREEILS